MLAAIPDGDLGFTDRGGFETSDDDYAKVVDAIIKDESGRVRAPTR